MTALASLAEAAPTDEFAAIGGLAVLARLEGAHRVTYDLDTVATQHGEELNVVETVVTTDGVGGLLMGTKIDCIAVGNIPAADIAPEFLPDAEPERIFVLAHRWALDTAEELTLIAEDDGVAIGQVRCRFASPASLVAMKLQSAPRRRAERSHKAGGDYLDLFRLVSHPTLATSISSALREAPHDLGTWCLREIQRCMVDDADRTAGIIVRSGVSESNAPTAAQLRRAGELLLSGLDRGGD
ncbi:MAG: nucleotidyl transferase AbiEii/AbiGii toxin family protein [Acidimicrobiales bacterium]